MATRSRQGSYQWQHARVIREHNGPFDYPTMQDARFQRDHLFYLSLASAIRNLAQTTPLQIRDWNITARFCWDLNVTAQIQIVPGARSAAFCFNDEFQTLTNDVQLVVILACLLRCRLVAANNRPMWSSPADQARHDAEMQALLVYTADLLAADMEPMNIDLPTASEIYRHIRKGSLTCEIRDGRSVMVHRRFVRPQEWKQRMQWEAQKGLPD